MKTKIGGQAVIEGVMMRGATSMALTVRDELGEMRTETTRLATKKPWYKKVPFLRGIINLVTSMIEGTKIISKSAEVMIEEEIDTTDNGMGGLMAISTLLGVVLALGLFVVLPTAITTGVFALFKLNVDSTEWAWLKSLIEGVAKMLVLIGYMAGISKMKEIKRVFMYHGAEHKTIACYEAGEELTVENIKKHSRFHPRCGTSFLLIVMVISIIVFSLLPQQPNIFLKMLMRIALLPVVAGLSYEIIKLAGRAKNRLVRFLTIPGLWLQRLTTREPDAEQIEVAIASMTAVIPENSEDDKW